VEPPLLPLRAEIEILFPRQWAVRSAGVTRGLDDPHDRVANRQRGDRVVERQGNRR
jgi:hypothetical protein